MLLFLIEKFNIKFLIKSLKKYKFVYSIVRR
jgi:hypothetical protein